MSSKTFIGVCVCVCARARMCERERGGEVMRERPRERVGGDGGVCSLFYHRLYKSSGYKKNYKHVPQKVAKTYTNFIQTALRN